MRKDKNYLSLWSIIFMMVLLMIASPLNAEAKNKKYVFLVNGSNSNTATCNSINDMLTSKILYASSKSIKIKKLLFDNKKNPCSESKFKKEMKAAYKGIGKNDMAIFYYVGHGKMSVNKGLIFKGDGWTPGNYITHKNLASILGSLNCKKILVILDCCYSGAFIDQGLSKLPSNKRKKFCVLTASSSIQEAHSWTNMMWFSGSITGVYSHDNKPVYGALTDKNNYIVADKNPRDGKITVNELYNSVESIYDEWKQFAISQDKLKSNELYMQGWFRGDWVVFDYDLPKVTMKTKSASLTKGKTKKLSATSKGIEKKITWKSSNTKIATVNSKGKVTAKKKGTCTITASIPGARAKCKITVKAGKKKKKKKTTSSGKYYSSISKTVTINKSTGDGLVIKTVNGNNYKKCPRLFVKVKILSIKGTPSRPREAYWLYHDDCDGMGSLFQGLDTSKLKKGNTLNANIHKSSGWSSDADMYGNSFIGLELPRGVSELKMTVTVYTKKGAKKGQIKSMKLKRS